MNKSYLKNLIAMAWADGEIQEEEFNILREAAQEAGLSNADLDEMLKQGIEYQDQIPENEEDRELQLAQMIGLAIADNHFSNEEYALCKMVAEKLGFTERELKFIINLSFKGKTEFEENVKKLVKA